MERIRKPTLTSELAAKIQERILSDGKVEGQHFMTEEEVAKEFGVSRRVAREAVSHLRALGVLRARRRKGLLIGAANPVELFAGSVQVFGRSATNFRELSRFRYVLETGAVDLAVTNVKPEQVERLKTLAVVYRKWIHTKPSSVEVRDNEVEFHGTLLAATGSVVIAGLHRVLLDFFHVERQVNTAPASVRSSEITAHEHMAIAEALERRDAEHLRALMRHHLASCLDYAEGKLPGS